jgi:PAS domain S-box-containing protein
MKQSTPRLLIYTAMGAALLLCSFLYILVSLNIEYNRFQKRAELRFNDSRTQLTDLRTEMNNMGKHQNSYLVFPNSNDSLGFMSASQKANKFQLHLIDIRDDSLYTQSDITQIHNYWDNYLNLSIHYLHPDIFNKNSHAIIYRIKEKIDSASEAFYIQLDKTLLTSRKNYQKIHDVKDDLYHKKIEWLIIGTGTMILALIYLFYLIFQQVSRKTRLQKRFQIFENAGDGLVATDADLGVTYVNRKTAQLLHKESADLSGVQIGELIPSLATQKITEIFNTSFNNQEARFIDSYHEPTTSWFRIGIYPYKKGLSLTIKDITELKQVESELKKSQKLYEFISKANDLILHYTNEDALYIALCELAITTGSFLLAWVGKPDENYAFIQTHCYAGKSKDYVKGLKIAIAEVPEGLGPSGRAFRTGKYYYCNDIANDPIMKPWRDNALSFGLRSSITVPIKLENTVVSIITFYSQEAFFFTEDQIQLLDRVIENVSFAITARESERKRKEAEQQLRIVNEAIEQSHSSVVITNVNGEIEYVNPAFSKLTGYTLEEVRMKNPRVLKTGHTPDAAYSVLWKTITNGEVWMGEFLNKKKNGETYWESATISPIQMQDGKITHFVAVKENITDRKKLEAEQQKLLSIIENSSAYMGTCDLSMQLTYGNESLRTVLEIGNEDITKYSIEDFRTPEAKNNMKSVYTQLNTHGKWVGENNYISRSGKEIPVMQVIMLHKDEQGLPAYVSTTAIDLSNIKKAEKELIRLNDELRNFTRHLQYIRETEKNTITKEIHDELGQGLASLKMDAVWIKKHLDDDKAMIQIKVDALLDSISEKLAAFNKFYLSANTSMIHEIGLFASIQYQAELFEKNHKIPVLFQSNMEKVRIQTYQGLNIYRILLECLSNILQHAHATQIHIQLNLINEEILELSIKDNGKGFDYNMVDTSKYHGLIDIRERVWALNGKLFVHSAINEGTRINIQIKIERMSDFSI